MNINKFNEALKFIHKKAKRCNIEISRVGIWSNGLYFFGVTEGSGEIVIATIDIRREIFELESILSKDGCSRKYFKVDEEGCVFEIVQVDSSVGLFSFYGKSLECGTPIYAEINTRIEAIILWRPLVEEDSFFRICTDGTIVQISADEYDGIMMSGKENNYV